MTIVEVMQSVFTAELLTKVAVSAIILVVTWVVVRLFKSAVKRMVVGPMASSIQRWGEIIIWSAGILFALTPYGLNVNMWVAVVVLLGLAMIVAARDVLPNLVGSALVSSYKMFKLGDWIKIGNYYGRVVEMNRMNTVLVGADNETIIIPNHLFVKEPVVNMSMAGRVRISVPLKGIDYSRYRLDELERGLLRIGREMEEAERPEVHITHIDHEKADLELTFLIKNPARKKEIESKTRKKVKEFLESLKSGKS